MKYFAALPGMVPQEAIERALRLLLLEIVKWGLPKEQIQEWHNNKTWFPTLRQHEDIVSLAQYIPEEFRQGEMCEPQILLHFPDENLEYELHPHLDQEPPWADGRKYKTICGVALSRNDDTNGGFIAWHQGFRDMWEQQHVNLDAGDILVFDPNLHHSGGLNSSGSIRAIVYFRYLHE